MRNTHLYAAGQDGIVALLALEINNDRRKLPSGSYFDETAGDLQYDGNLNTRLLHPLP